MEICGFLFPGQGAQKKGMGKEFYDNFQVAREIFEKADKTLDDCSIKELCFEADDKELTKTENTQPALYTVSYAIFSVLQEMGFKAGYFAGHSLGEYTAIAAAGYIAFEDGLRIVRKRGLLMRDCDTEGKGGMAAIIGIDEATIREVCEDVGDVVPANFNSPSQVVISGDRKKVVEAAEILKSRGAKKTVVLNVSGAFHSPYMKNVADKLKTALESIEWYGGKGKIVSNSTAEITNAPNIIRDNLIKQLYSPVLWNESCKNLIKAGCMSFVESGPGKVLKGLFRAISRDVKVVTVEKPGDIPEG